MTLNIKELVGSGDRIGKLALPFLAIGIALNVLFPQFFAVGGPSAALRTLSIVMLVPGIVVWAWSVFLILTKVPRHELITTGPFRLVKHPLYTGVALLVLPWAGFLLNTWLGLVFGIVLYAGSRMYAPAEEQALSEAFGSEWDEYASKVAIPWL
jgi:protein-S-isoprenylcysteine O-methyltransferase Ste14